MLIKNLKILWKYVVAAELSELCMLVSPLFLCIYVIFLQKAIVRFITCLLTTASLNLLKASLLFTVACYIST